MSLGNRIAVLQLSVAGLVGLTGCGATNTGQFAPSGFQQPEYQYQVHYWDASTYRLMPENWRIDNFYGEQQSMEPKKGTIYESDFEYDANGDGQPDGSETLFTYELRFTHLRTAGVIWVRAIPVAQYEGGKALDVFLQDYLESITGTGIEIARFGKLDQMKAKRYAPRLISKAEASIAGKEALAAVIDIANVDAQQVSPNARLRRVKLVLARPGFMHKLSRQFEVASSEQYPVILVAGYAEQPDYFEQNLPDFGNLLERFEIDRKLGYKEGKVTLVDRGGTVTVESASPSTNP